jgi:uncharacterized protein VirK/YbjX
MAKPGRTMKTLRLADAGLLRARLQRFARSLRGLYALRYWRGQLGLMRVMAHPGLAGLVRRRPRLLFKYLHGAYLASGLDSACRLAILTHHYACLSRTFRLGFLRTQLTQGMALWRRPLDPAAACITLVFSAHDLEGELMLAFWLGDDWIYTASLTLAHGDLMESGAEAGGAPGRTSGHPAALLITGLQGAAGKLALIRQATRACVDIAPPYLLLAAVRGIAAALGIHRILAVGNGRQLAKASGRALFDYDRFWTSLGGHPTGDGFYQVPAVLPDRPAPGASQLLSREGRRRLLKRDIAEAAAHRLRQGMRAPPLPLP